MKTSSTIIRKQCRILTLFVLLFVQSVCAFAGQWVDVTDAFVKNPRFDGNSYANWEGTALSGNGAVNNAEHYYKTYDTYQRLTGLTPGKYRVSVQAFYRMGSSANDYSLYSSGDYSESQIATVFARSTSNYYDVPMVCASSAALKQSLGGGTAAVGNGLVIPNNMAAANAWFEAGYYKNSVECEVDEDGLLTIGIFKENVIHEDWTCLDNWKLEYYEEQEVVRITSLSFDKKIMTVAKGKTLALNPNILPENATNKTLKWTSSDENVATVDADGVVTGVKGGKTVITATTTDMSGLSASVKITVYNVLTSDRSWVDVTDDYIINPRFDGNDRKTGWEGTAFGGANPKENAEHYNTLYDTYQPVKGLPAGKFRLSLNAFYRMGSSANDYNLFNSGDYAGYQYAQLYAVSTKDTYSSPIVPLASGLSKTNYGGATASFYNQDEYTYYYVPNNMAAADAWFNQGYYQNMVEDINVASDGLLTIGIKKEQGLDGDWTCLDNWKLECYCSVKLITSLTLSQTSAQLVNSETLQLSATILPAVACFRKLEWTSSDESVVKVDANGLVTAVGTGKAVVTASTTDGSEKSATCEILVVANDITSENVLINEIMVYNVDVYLDPSFNYGPWVELYNPSNTTVSLGGLYVTDDANNLKKHKLVDDYGVLPAHGFAILNFDHHEVWTKASYRQIDDELNSKGGTIILSDGEQILAQQTYPAPISRMSYARITDGGDLWGIAGNPTPGESNVDGEYATSQLAAPVVDTPAQLFDSPLTIRVTIPEGTTLRYTTDGTTPTLKNGSISETGVFSVDATTCYRFRLFQEGKLPSTVVTRSYIENNGNEPFPIISIVTDNRNIWGATYGVFSKSSNGRPGNGQTDACNWNMDWDRPVNFEYITTQGECVVSQECDFATCGGWSRAWNPHAFKLKAKKTYDLLNSFDYQFFAGKPYLKHKTLQIRNGGNDTSARIKDAGIQGVIEKSGIYADYQSWKPVHVFINGSPYAVLNMREPNNKDYAYSNYGYDTDLIDQFEICPDSGYVQMRGTEDSFQRWYELSQNAADESVYSEISNLVDMDNYINYMAIQFYIGNWDWPQNNVKGFRSVEDGKFHFVFFDLDGALSTSTPFYTFWQKQNYQFDTLHGYDYSNNQSIEGRRLTLEIKFVTIFMNMLQNGEFYKKFVDAYCLVAGSVFTPDLTSDVIYNRANQLAQGGYVNPWGTANDIINNFASRQTPLIDHLQYFLWLDENSRFKASLSSNIEEGRILLNDQPVPTGKFSGSLFLPITLRAEAPAGYQFAGWGAEGSSVTTTVFPMGSEWKYYDGGSLSGTWNALNYSDTQWSSGETPIGYDNNNQHPEIVTTTKGYLPTYYLRKKFTLSNVSANNTYQLDWIADDGFVVYVNGTEAGRYNMPTGTISYDTYATSYARNNPDNGTMILDASLFRKGNNCIAVELHNNASNSTDILWNAELSVQGTSADMQIVSTEKEYEIKSADDVKLQAIWEPLSGEELIAAGATPVKINEVSAANSVYLNEYFKKNDWIELYNTTDKDIDIAGMYISDNLKKPQKYQIPAASEVMATYTTIIPAHGYMVIWADQLLPESQIHTGFKLGNADDEVVMLTAADGTWSDTLSYKMHDGVQSVGLYPDGSSQAYVMDVPTIGESNILTSYATAFEQYRPEPTPPQPDAVREVKSDGDLRIAYSGSVLAITADSPMTVAVDVYNAAGQRVYSTSTDVYGSASVSLADLSNGVYVAKVSSSNDNRCQLKFVRR